MHRRSGGAGDNADDTREWWQRLFVFLGKQPLGGELCFQLLEGGIQVANAVHTHGAAIKLVSAIPRIDRNAPHGNHLHAVFRTKAQPGGIGLEHHTFQCCIFVLEIGRAHV